MVQTHNGHRASDIGCRKTQNRIREGSRRISETVRSNFAHSLSASGSTSENIVHRIDTYDCSNPQTKTLARYDQRRTALPDLLREGRSNAGTPIGSQHMHFRHVTSVIATSELLFSRMCRSIERLEHPIAPNAT